MTAATPLSRSREIGPGDAVVISGLQLDNLIVALNRSFTVRGPVVRSSAVVIGPVRRTSDLPLGWHDEQGPGEYRASATGDETCFGWAVGPASWKTEVFAPRQVLWRSEGRGEHLQFIEPAREAHNVAALGVRPCDVAALAVLDRVLENGEYPDPGYVERRRGLLIVAVECSRPSSSCFCSSMGTGPGLEEGFDLALTELLSPHRFLIRLGSERGARALADVTWTRATDRDVHDRHELLADAATRMPRHVDTDGLAALLAQNLDHPLWNDVAQRCLSCANCTMVCPTCFCSDLRDVTDLEGDTRRERTWSSCFNLDHSFLHGGPVRSSSSSRYRQWLTHKFSSWWDQFETAGCVGCGRCITWCPTGIDVTDELFALQRADPPIALAPGEVATA